MPQIESDERGARCLLTRPQDDPGRMDVTIEYAPAVDVSQTRKQTAASRKSLRHGERSISQPPMQGDAFDERRYVVEVLIVTTIV
jgi:hypothetical protein